MKISDFNKPVPFVTTWTKNREIHSRIDETYESTPEEIMKMWYNGLCSEEELIRILHVKNANDYILRAAIDTISVDPILSRVIVEQRRKLANKWSLENYFSSLTYGYSNFKQHLPIELQQNLKNISTGCLLSNYMNGIIFPSSYGLCSILSYSIRYVVEYASLALLSFSRDLSDELRSSALILAIRISKGIEYLDVDIHKRGKLSHTIRQNMRKPLPYICTFIAGHEYSHYLNGDTKKPKSQKLMVSQSQTPLIDSIFTYNHTKEYKADLTALRLPDFSDDEYANYYAYTLFWFVVLAIIEAANKNHCGYSGLSTHPSAIARFQNIIKNAPKPINFEEMEEIYTKTYPEIMEYYRGEIIKDVAIHPDIYEAIGRFYLA